MYCRRSRSPKMRFSFFRSSRRRLTMASAWAHRGLSPAADSPKPARAGDADPAEAEAMPPAGAAQGATAASRTNTNQVSRACKALTDLVEIDGFAIGLL